MKEEENKLKGFDESYSDKVVNQNLIGNMIRDKINSDDSLEFIRYVEKPNKIKFTCKSEDKIMFGKVDIVGGDGIIRKIEEYPIYRNAEDYKEIINGLYKKGKTQKQIAHRLGMSQTTISRVLKSK
ncbi:helix-turn-helix domain-containing protein [Clostridium perfringens]|uniref:HTH cro/C1-type domain-containing protein n=1 Tax=Clostridium perfringens TaxID=1502 RepID=A0A133N6C0_CLOPF|nr:winged helix-turn-helix domain-containing protein [Clostridium perfringens]KXA11846.1 hypothetical protein HMPREF3222_01635 [Clostridium perfringens]